MKKITAVVLILMFIMTTAVYAKNAYEYYNDGYDKYRGGDYKGALKEFKKAINKKPDFVKPYNMAGLAHVAMRHVDHAIYMYKKAVHIDKKFAEAWYNMGMAYEVKKPKDTKRPEKYYKKAIELDNDRHIFIQASLHLSKIYMKQKKYDDAILALRAAMKKVKYEAQEGAPLHNQAGLVYLESGHTDFAISHFQKALDMRQRYPEASTNLALAYQKQGKLARAITQLEDTLKKDENFAGAQYNYGNALIYNGFYEKAKAHLRKAIAIDPKFAEAHYSLGKAHAHLNEFAEAEKAYKTALEVQKNFTLAKRALDDLKKQRKEFRDHIVFKKKKTDEEGEEVVDEEEEGKKKVKAWEEDVEDLRLEDDKKKKEEDEEEDY